MLQSGLPDRCKKQKPAGDKIVGTPASYVNKLIRRDEGGVNNTFVKMLEALGYDIELHGKTAYHIGASIKDAGKKCFGISLLENPGMVADLLNRLRTV